MFPYDNQKKILITELNKKTKVLYALLTKNTYKKDKKYIPVIKIVSYRLYNLYTNGNHPGIA